MTGPVFPFAGFAGTSRGSFFRAPAWVDESKPPGTTSQASAYCPSPHWWAQAYTGYSLFFSPNLVWLAIALAVWALAPYDIDAAVRDGTLTAAWWRTRASVNLAVVYAYFGFWHVSLYWLGAGRRPFKADRAPLRYGRLAHNLLYTTLGVLQWTGWEALVVRAYASGRLPYLRDDEAFGTLAGGLNLLLSFFWVPLWRSWHFYFAHRLLHIRPLYRFVHSLHHRNTDIEPFSGLCMHPVEHLYYFACAAPSLYVYASPFAFMWNGMHLLLSPAASHSGFEDHFQSDQFHYLHHKFFECNYGPADNPFDRWFGTFRDRLEPPAAKAAGGGGGPAVTDAKATVLGAPDRSFCVYALLAVCAPLAALRAALSDASAFAVPGVSGATAVALLCSVGPVAVGALLLTLADARKALAQPRATLASPFHKERLLGALGMHVGVGAAMTVLPVYHLVRMSLAPPGEAAYCSVHTCAETVLAAAGRR